MVEYYAKQSMMLEEPQILDAYGGAAGAKQRAAAAAEAEFRSGRSWTRTEVLLTRGECSCRPLSVLSKSRLFAYSCHRSQGPDGFGLNIDPGCELAGTLQLQSLSIIPTAAVSLD